MGGGQAAQGQGQVIAPVVHRTDEAEDEGADHGRGVDQVSTVGTRGGGIGRRLRRLFGIRSPLLSSDDSGSPDTQSSIRYSRRRHMPRHSEYHRYPRCRHQSSSSESSSDSTDPPRRRRRPTLISEPYYSRNRSSIRHVRSPPVDRSCRCCRGHNDHSGIGTRRRRFSERVSRTRHTREAAQTASHRGTGRMESIRFSRERRRRHTRHAGAVDDSRDSRPYPRDRSSHIPSTPPPHRRRVRQASPIPLSVIAPDQSVGPPNYDAMSEDELFGVILAEERAMDPVLRDLDARRARGEDV